MKKRIYLVILHFTIVTFAILSITGCENLISMVGATPVVEDYNISGIGAFPYDGSSKVVIVTPKEGKSSGDVTVKYNGKTEAPSAVGEYEITFDVAVAAGAGFSATNGLYAGMLTITAPPLSPPSPIDGDGDYIIIGIGEFPYDGNPKVVTVTPKPGKSPGVVTVKYNGDTDAPSAVGEYEVTFDVAAATGWNVASGLYAGLLKINLPIPVNPPVTIPVNPPVTVPVNPPVTIPVSPPNQSPTALDFNVDNLTQTEGSVTPVTITPKQGKSTGKITIYYNGSTVIPQKAGTYAVTFNVAAATGWDMASGLSVGTLTITAVSSGGGNSGGSGNNGGNNNNDGTGNNRDNESSEKRGSDGSEENDGIVESSNYAPVERVVLDKKSASVAIGGQIALSATIIPEYATITSIIWTSENEDIATVTEVATELGASLGAKVNGKSNNKVKITVTVNGISDSCEVTVLPPGSLDSRFVYYWVDDHGSLVDGATTMVAGRTLTITAKKNTGYKVVYWFLNGVNTGQNGNEYFFSSEVTGEHIVGLFAEKNGKLYNTNIIITVW